MILFCAALLAQAKQLIENHHSIYKVIQGYKNALQSCLQVLNREALSSLASSPISPILIVEVKESTLSNLIKVPLYSKIVGEECVQHIYELLSSHVKSIVRNRLNIVLIEGGHVTDSIVFHGIMFKKPFTFAGSEQMKKSVQDASLLLLDYELELKHAKEFAHLNIKVEEYREFVEAEWSYFNKKLMTLFQHEQVQENFIVLNEKSMGDFAQQLFQSHGIDGDYSASSSNSSNSSNSNSNSNIINYGRVSRLVLDQLAEETGGRVHCIGGQVEEDDTLGKCKSFRVEAFDNNEE